jgi:hypothetical protein
MKLVLCEGEDDAAVLHGICGAASIEGLSIESIKGRSNLERVVRELPIRSDYSRGAIESIAIIIDAEEDAEASWQKLRNAFRSGLDVRLPGQGELTDGKPRCGGFVVGMDAGVGMIEDVCLLSVRDEPGFHCLEEYFRCLAERTDVKTYHSKAKFRAWMASQSEYEAHVGRAAKLGFLNWGSAAFEPLREFLKRV